MALIQPPAPRIPYDVDGSIVSISRTVTNDHNPFVADQATRTALNSNFATGLAIGSGLWDIPTPEIEYYAKNWIAISFPRPMDIKAVFLSAWTRTSSQSFTYWARQAVDIQTSNDSSNGLDGTWATIATKDETSYALPIVFGTSTFPPYEIGTPSIGGEVRDVPDIMYQNQGPTGPGWMTVVADNVEAIRLYLPRRSDPQTSFFGASVFHFHVYGTASAVSGNRLEIRNAAGTAPANLAIGNVFTTAYVERTVRVKNLSTTKIAYDVVLGAETAGVPVYFPPSYFNVRLSVDGVNWLPAVRLGDIPANGLSPSVLLRVDPVPGMVGLHFARAHAFAGGWS